MKRVILFLLAIVLVTAAIGAGIIYYYRYNIFQYSAETIIRKKLPPYINVGELEFDLERNVLRIKDLSIKNPKGFSQRSLAVIGDITCRYKMLGKNILEGIEITEITAERPSISIERVSNGKLNVANMNEVMSDSHTITPPPSMPAVAKPHSAVSDYLRKLGKKVDLKHLLLAQKHISELIKLPNEINIKNGDLVFLDNSISARPYELTFDNINGSLDIQLNDDYTAVLSVSSQGNGILNGDISQRVGWAISLYPREKELTMSNRFEVRNIDITLFEHYYNKFSPIVVLTGRCSGTLVFDFDHGNIGSTNTLQVKALRFREKTIAGGAGWDTASIPELIKYLRSAPDEVTFDFKIKGTIDDPRFYPGPYVKQAIQSMVVNKVGETIQQFTKEGTDVGGNTGKVADVIKGLLRR